MSRLLVSLVVILVIVIGGLFFFGSRTTERPVTHIEQPVSLGNLT